MGLLVNQSVWMVSAGNCTGLSDPGSGGGYC